MHIHIHPRGERSRRSEGCNYMTPVRLHVIRPSPRKEKSVAISSFDPLGDPSTFVFDRTLPILNHHSVSTSAHHRSTASQQKEASVSVLQAAPPPTPPSGVLGSPPPTRTTTSRATTEACCRRKEEGKKKGWKHAPLDAYTQNRTTSYLHQPPPSHRPPARSAQWGAVGPTTAVPPPRGHGSRRRVQKRGSIATAATAGDHPRGPPTLPGPQQGKPRTAAA